MLALAGVAAAADTPAVAPVADPAAAPAVAALLAAAKPADDLGSIFHGDTASHTFVLRNSGPDPITIQGVKPACGCTVVEFDATIAPGKEGKLTAAVDTSTLGSGAGKTHLLVYSSDPASPLRLDLAYSVVDRLFASPGYARWKSTQGERDGTIANTVWTTDSKEFQIVGVDTPGPHLRAAFRPATDAEREAKANGPQWRVELTLASMAPPGAITGFVKVHTNHPEQKTLNLPISGFVRPTTFLFPEVGDFGTVEAPRLPLRAFFKFQNFATEPIAVTGVEVDVAGVVATVEAVEAGREYKVAVILPAGMPAGPFSGTLTLRTDSPKAPTVTAPVKGVVAPPKSS